MFAKLITSVSYDLEVDIFAHLQECSLKTVKKRIVLILRKE